MNKSIFEVLMRSFLTVIGLLSLLIGVAGIFIPLLPTTPFILLSAYCFQKSSPRLHRWLTDQPFLGPILRDWDEKRIITKKTKGIAITTLWLGLSWPLIKTPLPIWVKVMATGAGIAITVFIAKQKSKEAQR